MKNAEVSTLFKPLAKLFQKFHITLFIVILVAGLAFAVLSLNNLLTEAANPQGMGTTTTGQVTNPGTDQFDEQTIQKINSLHSSDAPTSVVLPEGRINPFSE